MNFEDELILDAELDAQEVAFIISKMDEEARSRVSEDEVFYFIDVLCSYYAESGLLDTDEEEIDLPVDAIVEYLQNTARRELQKDFSAEDLIQIIEADMEFAESEE